MSSRIIILLSCGMIVYSCATSFGVKDRKYLDKFKTRYDYFDIDSLDQNIDMSNCARSSLDSSFRIYFADGFEDSLLISINGTVLIKDYYETNGSVGLAMGPRVVLERTSILRNKLMVKSLSNNRLLKCDLDFSLPYCEISMYDSLWFLRYSDYHCDLE
tara:strand:+ start:956 stop:1432 length:477 start_codon:yes stop_codon:yes gene_type:complete